MLNIDLAILYKTKTKRINEAVFRKGHTAFTEEEVAMLATVLKSNVATNVSNNGCFCVNEKNQNVWLFFLLSSFRIFF